MFYTKTAFAVILLGIFVWLAIMNCAVFWHWYILKKETPSLVPVLGGFFGVIGLAVMVPRAYKYIIFIPLVLDSGCFLTMVVVIGNYLRKILRIRAKE